MIFEIFAAKRHSENALADRHANFVLDEVRPTLILEGGEAANNSGRAAARSQRETAGVARNRATPDAATALRNSTRAESELVALHSVCIGELLCCSLSLCHR